MVQKLTKNGTLSIRKTRVLTHFHVLDTTQAICYFLTFIIIALADKKANVLCGNALGERLGWFAGGGNGAYHRRE